MLMSTQAPSATPGDAGPSDAGGDGEAQHLPSPKLVREGKAALPRGIKPIPNKPKVQLPGVDTGFDGTSAFDSKIAKAIGRGMEAAGASGLSAGDGAEFGSKPEAAAKSDATPRERGADGKFLKPTGADGEAAEAAAPQEGDEATEADDSPVETPDLPDEDAEVETLESLTAKHKEVEQKYRSLQGMFKPIQLKAQEAIREQHGAAKSAIAWKAKAESLEAELTQLRSGNGNGGAASASPSASGSGQEMSGRTPSNRIEGIVKAIDWKMYGSVKEQGDDAVAVWLTDQILGMVDKDTDTKIQALESKFNNFTQPINDSRKMQEIASHATEVFTRVAEIKDESGEVAFPELYDATEAEAVGKAWVESGKPPEDMLTPRGVIDAILFYRFINGKNRTPSSPLPAAGSQEPGDEGDGDGEGADESGGNARPTRSLLGSRASIPLRTPSTPGSPRDLAASIKNAMRDTTESDNLFGFPTRKMARR
jgi:hypothetical protein